MFKIALRTFWSDIRTFAQGWGMWILLLLITFLIGVLPMIADDGAHSWIGGCFYGIMASFFWLAPRFTRAFHVAPFTISQIKKIAVYRCIFFLIVAMIVGGIYLAFAWVFSWDWNPGFGLWYFLYTELYFVFMSERLKSFHSPKHKTNIWLGVWITVIMIASIIAILVLAEDLPLYVQYLIQIGLLLLYLPYPISEFKDMDFYDYRQVRDSFGGRPTFLE